MAASVTVWRYSLLRDKPTDGWSIVFIDSKGFVSIVSEYGHWGYCWPSRHTEYEDVRDFLLTCDWDYVARKLGRQADLQVFDGEATERNIRRHICEHRRSGGFTRERARRLFEGVSSMSDLTDFHAWYLSTDMADAYELIVYRMAYGLEHWVKISFERLKTQIREQLAQERGEAA